MRDYSEFPPLHLFIKVLKSHPKSALLFVQIWKKKGASEKISINKEDIRNDYQMSPTMLRGLLLPLMFQNLVQLVEKKDEFQIEVSETPQHGQ